MKSKANYDVTCNYIILDDLVYQKLLHHMFMLRKIAAAF